MKNTDRKNEEKIIIIKIILTISMKRKIGIIKNITKKEKIPVSKYHKKDCTKVML